MYKLKRFSFLQNETRYYKFLVYPSKSRLCLYYTNGSILPTLFCAFFHSMIHLGLFSGQHVLPQCFWQACSLGSFCYYFLWQYLTSKGSLSPRQTNQYLHSPLIHLVTLLATWQMFTECLLCAEHCANPWDRMVNKTGHIPALMGLSRGKQKHWIRNFS